MALYSVKTEGESQNIYSFFTENGFDYVRIHTTQDYKKNGLTGAYLEKLRRLAADNWDYSIDEDRNVKFTEAVFRTARAMDKEMKDLPAIEEAHPLLQRLYFLALNDNDSHEAIVDPMAISDYEIDFKMSWDMLLDGIKKDIVAFGLKDDIDTCNDEFELVVKSSVLPKFKVKYRG